MKVLGLKIKGHDTGAALISGGKVVAIAEERLNRVKHSFNMFPSLSIDYCLDALGVNEKDVSLVVIDQIGLREEIQMEEVFRSETGERFMHAKVEVINHHNAHAASAFFASPFNESAVLVYDGTGEKHKTHLGVSAVETDSLYNGEGNNLTLIQKTTHVREGKKFLYSFGIGKLYGFISSYYLGFGAYNEGKMMGLAPYSTKTLFDEIPLNHWFTEKDGHILCNPNITFPRGKSLADTSRPTLLKRAIRKVKTVLKSHSKDGVDPELFPEIRLKKPPRTKEQKLPDEYYTNVAYTVQKVLEEVAYRFGKRLKDITKSDNLCIAGGVGLNIDANKNFYDRVGFKDVFIQPAASDTGIALGCALWGYHMIKKQPRFLTMKNAALGKSYSEEEIAGALRKVEEQIVVRKSDEVAKEVADMIANGQIIGWFYAGAEYGPRALGHRSILCDARNPKMKDILNERVKHREGWRPFAAVMLEEYVNDYFELDKPSPYMLLAAKVRLDKKKDIPSVIHVDNTSRIQTVTKEANGRYHELVSEFYALTGTPILLNTSFNLGGDPIVEKPEDALDTFLSTNIDALVLENYIVTKKT